MLECRAFALLGAATLITALAGCGAGSTTPAAPVATAPTPAPVQQASPLQSVQIVARGSEVFPGSSVTDFVPGQLSYSSTSSISGDLKFTAAISAEDFQRLANLVESANLTKTLGELPAGVGPCRSFGYDIAIKRGGVTYQFTIPGDKTCGGLAPAGLDALLNLQTELLAKYTPKAGN